MSIQDQINSLKNTKATQASVNALNQKVDNTVEATQASVNALNQKVDNTVEYVIHNLKPIDMGYTSVNEEIYFNNNTEVNNG